MAAAAASRETHISQIFFTADRAYKLLKPVRMSFLDLTDREQRLAAARRELDLNQRIAPDVYLGLGDLHEHGELVDHLIVMRRMPDDRRLSDLLRSGADTDDHLRAVARTVAVFHAGLDPITDDDTIATAAATRDRWEDNFVNIERSVGPVIDPVAFDRAHTLALRYVDANPALFASRIRGGFIRDGHGDLIADDIFCLDDGPRILDCLAFRDDFRIGDVLSDIAFLVMDVHRLAGAEPGRRLMRWYQEYADEHHPSSLAHHYVAYRAHVRAKVACLAHEQGVARSGHPGPRLPRPGAAPPGAVPRPPGADRWRSRGGQVDAVLLPERHVRPSRHSSPTSSARIWPASPTTITDPPGSAPACTHPR